MAYENDQTEFPLPDGSNQRRQSARHLPKYFRTDKNKKFLQSTLDQILQPGVAEKINSFVGRKTAKSFSYLDNYLEDISPERENYQLEPVAVIKDSNNNVDFYGDYRDFINQIANFNGVVNNHGRNTKEEFYAWDPHIDWDKFSNFRNYYWLPNGPQTVVVPGETTEITSTYSVNLLEALGDYSYIFTPDGLTNNPSLKLYRGVKYIFDINTPGLPITFRTERSLDDQFLLRTEVSQQGVEEGTVEIVLGPETPNEIFYVAENDINVGGIIRVANQSEASFIDVETEIIGKKFYTTRDGWSFTNGLKIRFEGEVVPSKYKDSEWYVEGVGKEIKLVSSIDVEVSFPVGIDVEVPFDDDGFDNLPFSEAIGYPRDKDYITINRSSTDGNFWSRYNRWFHEDIIELSARINGVDLIIDQSQRASRPIIEFESGLKLYNFGTKSKDVIDLVDDYTTDAFSTIEGSLGYNIDGVQLTEGMRVLFLADTDPLVKGKIFKVTFIKFTGSGTGGQISLIEVDDSNPVAGENVLVVRGQSYGGKIWYYDGENWNLAQEKTSVNQPPIFDVFDDEDISFSNTSKYPATSFRGTKIFSYKQSTGTPDAELGFPLSYRSIENVGDIVFDFDFNKDTFQYQINNQIITNDVKSGFLRKYKKFNSFEVVGVYTRSYRDSEQRVILQYINDGSRLTYPINCYDQSAYLNDLVVRVYVNNVKMIQDVDYELVDTADKFKAVNFLVTVPNNAAIILRCASAKPKNKNGYYAFPYNFERNPLNDDVTVFTLGEISEHVTSIINTLDDLNITNPFRDVASPSIYGNKFIKHSSPLNLSLFSMLDKDSNVIKSIRFAKKEYNKFKRVFLEIAENLGFEGSPKKHVDAILSEFTKDKVNSMPFYFSDMLPFGAAITTRITVEDIDSQFFALNVPFTLDNLSNRAVTVYINNTQLIHNIDYTFNSEGFLQITAPKQFGDIIEINEYETTSGSYIPPTPSKLGLYPTWVPEKFLDQTYTPAIEMIRGHDGSLVRAFADYRDDLILELERRIFNNIKIKYDTSLHNIHSYLPGLHRKTAFSRDDVYKPMTTDFIQWLSLVSEDYTTNKFYDRNNSFTFNYSKLIDKNNEKLPGWWRGIYKYYFDTDRPHTSPWEMLGFTIKPSWWESVYGPAPYTRNNLLLWEDLEKGIIREPGKGFKINRTYERPGLTTFIPVDSKGNLLGPSDCNIPKRFDTQDINSGFIFGDNAPVESAWTNSSEYPFALITSWAINNMPTLLATGFDRSRQIRNALGQIVYKPTMSHIRLADLVFPNTADDTTEILTSGIINYVAGYMASNLSNAFDNYQENIKSIKNNLAFKLGGFTDKSKFKLILDSRTPLNNSNVFVPEENYQIFLNTSFPIKNISYSGVIVEVTPQGFVIRGYDREVPSFNYYKPYSSANDMTVNVGGVSEPFVDWAPNQTYAKNLIIRSGQTYYRVKNTFTSTNDFSTISLEKLPMLPVTGGVNAIFKRKFDKTDLLNLPYGSVMPTVQDVVDFLLGYENWLKEQGFKFEYFDGQNNVISDWKNSCREFMFWTTHNWDSGAIISLSPAADQIYFETNYTSVDDVYSNFYGSGLIKSDGRTLSDEFVKISRQDQNTFKIEPRGSAADGIYSIKIPLVQKEHVVLIDNSTVFGDIIYQPATGYRQDRIKAFGYRTTEWDGSLNIPGFLYSEIIIKDWEQWKDYSIGDVVKYKEFYYSANQKNSGAEVFDYKDWTLLDSEPESKLLTNFEYKVNQFADFYDLDTDNFDITQQKLAQHLIGYQKRDYLENIINDEVSQYKFYQGMIQEKGTKNVLNKLFDVLSSNDSESLDFYEEWAVKQGQYGANEGFEEVEFRLDEKKFRLNPQPIQLTNADSTDANLVYRIKDFEVFKKPKNYSNDLFPKLSDYSQFTRSPGFVNVDDVGYVIPNYESLLTLSISDLDKGDYVWVGSKNTVWDVLQYQLVDTNIIRIETLPKPIVPDSGAPFQVEVILNNAPDDIKEGDIVGITNIIIEDNTNEDSTKYPVSAQKQLPLEGFFKVVKVVLNKIYLNSSSQIELVSECIGLVTKFESVKVSNYEEANILSQKGVSNNSLIWVENNNENWKVLKNNQAYNLLQLIPAEETGQTNEFGKTITVDNRNSAISIASPSAGNNGKAFIYTRGGNGQNFQFTQIIEPSSTVSDLGVQFGTGQAFSIDGKYLIIGSPAASNVKTRYRGDYDPAADYQNGDIIQYAEQLWEVVVDIRGADEALPFGSFSSIIEVLQQNNIFLGEATLNSVITGNYPFKNVETDHILVRAAIDQYQATGIGDTVFFDWYLKTTANQSLPGLVERQPFNGAVPGIDETFLESGLVIQQKVDAVLFVNSVSTVPQVNDQVESQNVFGYVSYVYQEEGRVTIYIRDTSGQWPLANSLFLETGEFVGDYVRSAPVDTIDLSDSLGGYWLFNVGQTIQVGEVNSDEGRALGVYNIIPQGKPDPGARGGNIIDLNNSVTNIGDNSINSYIRTLTYQGTPGPAGNLAVIPSDLFVVRAPKDLTDQLVVGDEVGLEVVRFPRFSNGFFIDLTPTGLTYEDTNKKHTLYGLWDGYIDFDLDYTDNFGAPFEPRIGQFVRERLKTVTGNPGSQTGATAKVAFYQKFNNLRARIYVTNVQGSWGIGNDNRILEMIGDPTDPSIIYRSDQPLGDIRATALGSASLNIGKLCVFQLAAPIEEVPENATLIGAEYLIYKDFEILGLPTQPNIPSANNFDYKQVFKIPVDPEGYSNNLTNYGYFTVYERENISTFTPVNSFIFPIEQNNLRIGSKIKIAKKNDFYKAFIGCEGNGTTDNPGKIYFVSKGVDEEGITYDWEVSKDKRYKGQFITTRDYFLNDYVYHEGYFYKALTNVAGDGSTFIPTEWQLVTNDQIRSIDYLGYIPNDTAIVPEDYDYKGFFSQASTYIVDEIVQYFNGEFYRALRNIPLNYSGFKDNNGVIEVPATDWEKIDFTPGGDQSLKLDTTNLIKFGRSFDVSDNGEVLISTAEYVDGTTKVVVYRNVNDHYQKRQEIVSPLVDDANIKFGVSISISQDGRLIAIGAPGADDSTYGSDIGAVFVYKQTDDTFELVQTLRSTTPIKGEDFGRNLDFDGRTLYVSAFNASSDDITTFDNSSTIFDADFTVFKNRIANNGVVYVYDRIDDSLVFGQTIDYHTYALRDNIRESDFFGRNILAKNNHLYVSIPEYENRDGKLGLVLDYRRPDNTRVWEIHREYTPPVNLEKIKKIMLYDLSKNAIIEQLDYIDPIQGKIAGPADEEIRYKTVIDPAIYNFGNASIVNVNETENWGQAQVGRVWWDLSTVKFLNAYQGNIIYKTNNFNTLYPGSSVDVYEWVESQYTPAEWDRLSLTADGRSQGITGTSKYGPEIYSRRREYDSIAKQFTNYYYFWVKNKTSVPNVTGRSLAVDAVAKLIEDPAGQGYRFITFPDSSSFVLHNCNSLIKDTDVVLNIQYWTYGDRYSNIHNQYQLVTEGLSSSVPNAAIIQKLIDSLVGYDVNNRPVPDPSLSVKERYGILNKPRQSWFINRTEALKQVVERVNLILKNNLIVDEKDITGLTASEPSPTFVTGKWDVSVDAQVDLQFVGVVNAKTARLQPVVEDGKIVRVDILDAGRGYKVVPTYELTGQGSDALLDFELNNLGQIVDVVIKNPGFNYNENTFITVRPFTVLVQNDETINGRWALYEKTTSSWIRVGTQSYDVNAYWDYADWYAEGFNEFTEIDHVIDFSYGLQGLNDRFGDIVKILNVGGSGWLLLEKIDNQETVDYTVNYRTIGKQNGTIQLKDSLYNFANNSVGFDNQTFDTQFFDVQPVEETRRILDALKDDVFVADLANEFNNIFFACLRYVFAEQGYVDWAFKTSFVKARHNVGELLQRVNFKNDSLESYENFVKEAKPYKTKIREYISNYTKVDNSRSSITDFDSPPRFNQETQRITAADVKVVNNVLFGTGLTTLADQSWLNNLSYQVIEIQIADPGFGYVSAPEIIIEGTATAKASLGPRGIISNVKVIDSGSGYLSVPSITVNGTLRDGGRPAKLTAVIGNSPVRSMHTTVKFDRVSGSFFITKLDEVETFVANGSQLNFNLKWPMDMRSNTVEVFVDGDLVLNSNYTYDNYNNRKDGYDKFYGRIDFIDPPANESIIEINYKKSIRLLDAQDRINLFYNPTDGQIGNDITQLMDGVDYGGVQVKSFEFGAPPGWDTDSWYTSSWDLFDETFDDETFETDGSTLSFDLAKPLEKGVKYNVYINGTRVDDDNWDGTSTVSNPYAIMAPIVGDGVTDTFIFENEVGYRQVLGELGDVSGQNNPPGDFITIRKASSDGSLKVSEDNYDTAITGGDLAYTTALGINAEDIVIDGDGFVTATTSKGPEEVVPGQVMDTLDIVVYERPNSGSGTIKVSNYKADGITREFDLVQRPFKNSNVIVKIGDTIIDTNQYRVDYTNNSIVFYNPPTVGLNITVISTGLGGTNLLDYGELVSDGSTQLYPTPVRYSEEFKAYVTVNGIVVPFEIIDQDGSSTIKFATTPEAGRLIQFGIFDSVIETFSQVTVDTIIADGSSIAYELSQAPFAQQPSSYYTVVTVNDSRVLSAGYSEEFIVQEGILEYKMKVWQIPVGSREGRELRVFLNERELEFLQEWTYEGAGSFNPNISPDAQPGSTIILNKGIANAGDELKVFVISSGEYRFGYYDSSNEFVDTSGVQTPATVSAVISDGAIVSVNIISSGRGYNAQSAITATGTGTGAEFSIEVDNIGRITNINVLQGGSGYDNNTTLNIEIVPVPAIMYFDETFNSGDVIKVYQFSNHDGLGIERENYSVVERTQMTVGSEGYYDYRDLKNSRINLRKEAVSVDYVWVSINGEWLTPTADYVLLENKKTIQFVTKLNDFDTIDIIHFASPPISNRFGWRQFKDMLNKTTYLRLSRDDEHYLAKPLRWYDRTIEVSEGFERLPEPKIDSKRPGVLFINGERIEYFRREGNVLKQLRRGTLGTGVKDEYPAGTQFYNQSTDSIVPYKDEEERVTAVAGKYTDMSTIYPVNDPDISVTGITYSFNNNTVFPVRVPGVFEQIATVTGSGFRPEVQVIMQDADGNERQLQKISSTDTEIQFYTETMPVGAYDLVIYNPREETPAIRAATSLVVKKFLPYVQILLPFEPEAFTDVVKNPVETGEWYKAPFNDGGIPGEYWQALNIEVFANGRRLRKTPIKAYDVNKGQFSPDGDIDAQAEFAVNRNEGAYVRLTNPPAPETTLVIVRKLGTDWREVETTSPLRFKPLGISNTQVATFLRGKTINLPR